MRVLLTGATGYLGRRIARKLAIQQHEVVAVLCPLDDADRLHWYAARADGFIHAAGSQSAGFPEIIERALGVVELALPDGAPCVSIEGPIAAPAA
jgi:nucleoside-diphosphate-sugar epimerase